MIFQRNRFLALAGVLFLACLVACTSETSTVPAPQTPKADFTSFGEVTPGGVVPTPTLAADSPEISNGDPDCVESSLTGLVLGQPGQDVGALWQVGACGDLTRLSSPSFVGKARWQKGVNNYAPLAVIEFGIEGLARVQDCLCVFPALCRREIR